MQILHIMREDDAPAVHLDIIGVNDGEDPAAEAGMHRIPRHIEQIGEAAARMLDALLQGKPLPSNQVLVEPDHVAAPTGFRCSSPMVRRALDLTHELHAQQIGTDDLARVLGVNRRQLERAFRADIDQTVLEVLQSIRVERAYRLLELDERPIGSIAEAVGFGSIDRFMACFKKQCGMTARQWRQKHAR